MDHVHAVEHFVRPGETLASARYDVCAGGKGFNQSIALARAGAEVIHVGAIGQDGGWLIDLMRSEGIDVGSVKIGDEPTGHAIIQVAPNGENAIILHAGANARLSADVVANALSSSVSGDFLLLQNETNFVPDTIELGRRHGIRVAFNAAPMSPKVLDYPLEMVDFFFLNETEAEALTGKKAVDEIHEAMLSSYPHSSTILTLGSKGAAFLDPSGVLRRSGESVDVVTDTTAAGDTFIGYFLMGMSRINNPQKALDLACRAAAICVTRPGAARSIPRWSEI